MEPYSHYKNQFPDELSILKWLEEHPEGSEREDEILDDVDDVIDFIAFNEQNGED